MNFALEYWVGLFKTHRDKIAALDIETTKYNGQIAVVGISKRKSNPMAPVYEEVQLVKGKTLSRDSIKWALEDTRILMTFNGKNFDLPRIEKEFPGAIPQGIQSIDLYLLAKQLGLSSDLKNLEKTFSLRRPQKANQQPGKTSSLWKSYEKDENVDSLQSLLVYNKYDTRNLFELADQLIYWADLKLKNLEKLHKAICEASLPS